MSPKFWMSWIALFLLATILDGVLQVDRSLGLSETSNLVAGLGSAHGLNTQDGLSFVQLIASPGFYTSLMVRIVSWNFSFFQLAGGIGLLVQGLLAVITWTVFIYSFGRQIAGGLTRVVGGIGRLFGL